MLIGFQGFGESPDGIGQPTYPQDVIGYNRQFALAPATPPALVYHRPSGMSGCAPGSNCCAECASQPALGGVEDRAGVLLETGIGAFIGYVFAPQDRPSHELAWVSSGAALGGFLGKWGLALILGAGLYERYGRR